MINFFIIFSSNTWPFMHWSSPNGSDNESKRI